MGEGTLLSCQAQLCQEHARGLPSGLGGQRCGPGWTGEHLLLKGQLLFKLALVAE